MTKYVIILYRKDEKIMNKQEILTRYSKEEEKLLVSKVLDKIEFVLNRNTIENTDFYVKKTCACRKIFSQLFTYNI